MRCCSLQYCDGNDEISWEQVAEVIDNLPGWDGCGERWAAVAGAGRSTARGARGRLKTVLGVVGVAAVTAHIYKHKDSSNLGLNADALRESIDSVKSLWGEYVHAYFAGGGGDSKGSVDARAV